MKYSLDEHFRVYFISFKPPVFHKYRSSFISDGPYFYTSLTDIAQAPCEQEFISCNSPAYSPSTGGPPSFFARFLHWFAAFARRELPAPCRFCDGVLCRAPLPRFSCSLAQVTLFICRLTRVNSLQFSPTLPHPHSSDSYFILTFPSFFWTV